MYFQKFLFVAFATVTTQIVETEAHKAPKCKGLDIKVSEEQLMNVKECMKSVGMKNMEMTPKQMNCLSKCIMEKKGLVGIDGRPHKENVLKVTGEAFPEPIKEEFKAAMEQCLQVFSENSNPADENCMSYGPLAICVHKAFIEICN